MRNVYAVILSLGLVLYFSCRQSAPPAPKQQIEATALPRITVTPKAKLLFIYAKENGSFDSLDQLDKVPETSRGWVRIVDLNVKPDKRLDRELVYVADLRSVGKDGNYPYVVMSREAFESAAVSRSQQGATTPVPPAAKGGGTAPKGPPTISQQGGKSGTKEVILYSTSWCSACRAAREYFTQKQIPFLEKDIEKENGAAEELLQKAKVAGIPTSGVPIIDINGTLMQGFDPQRVDALLGEK